MTRNHSFRRWTLVVTALTLALPPALFANDAVLTSTTRPTDVALLQGGVLQGQLLDANFKPLAEQEVFISRQGEPVAAVLTDEQGRFAFTGLRGGTYVVETATASNTFQLWAPNTAPPSAQQGALVLSGNDPVVRGKKGSIDKKKLLITGTLIGLGAAGLYWALDHNSPGS